MNGHLATVRWLRERGAPAVPFCGGPILPISLAARGGYGDTVEYLRLAGAPAPVEIKHGDWADWVDAVHLAVGRNDLRRLVYLHDEVGVPLTMKRGAGEWPIHTAARFGHLESVTYLHEHGAALGVKDIHGTQPMHLAFSPRTALTSRLSSICTHTALRSTPLTSGAACRCTT